MKKKLSLVLVLVLILASMLTACGEKECEHEFTEANYQTPATCTLCGITEGDVVPAYYPTTNLPVNSLAAANPGDTYTFRTVCALTEDETVGTITLKSYEVFESNENFEAVEGYVYHKLSFDTMYADGNAINYGINFTVSFEDYYDMQLLADTFGDDDNDGIYTYMVNYNGEEMTAFIHEPVAFYDDFNGTEVVNHLSVVYRVPAGYDGAIFTFTNVANIAGPEDWAENFYQEDEVVFFRLDGQIQ